MFQIEEELKKLPGKPGVYIMHGEKDEIIYVGKAVMRKTTETAKITKTVQHLQRRTLSEIYIRKIPEEDVSDRKEEQK